MTGYCISLCDSLVLGNLRNNQLFQDLLRKLNSRHWASVASEVTWLKELLKCFEVHIYSSMIFCDRQAAIRLFTNPKFHLHSKHVEIDCHFIRENVAAGFIKLIKVVSAYQLKGLISELGMLNIYTPT